MMRQRNKGFGPVNPSLFAELRTLVGLNFVVFEPLSLHKIPVYVFVCVYV